MPLENSPSFDSIETAVQIQGSEANNIVEKTDNRRQMILSAILVTLVVALGISELDRNGFIASYFASTGTIEAYAIDSSGLPIRVDVFIHDTNIESRSDADGYYIIGDIPIGDISVIVAAGNIAAEGVVTVIADQTVQVPTLTITTEFSEILESYVGD